MKPIVNEIPRLNVEGNKLSGGFSSLQATQMAKIKGGGGTNGGCTNNALCNSGMNDSCSNRLGCEGTTNHACTNQYPCGVTKPVPVLQ